MMIVKRHNILQILIHDSYGQYDYFHGNISNGLN
jgi:hypothetical protein